MPLNSGSKLGSYEIVALLGAGGMGEVYRARDTRLGREVAIKALPAEVARDPDRLARFEREAKLLASLSHAHIAGIHGIEDIQDHRYLILEFVEGETLAQRLDRGTLTIDEALQVGRQIAAALESAHEAGIAHRDLKPGNVMLTSAGDVKVLDFGLAKGGLGAGSSASDISMSHSPTLTHQHTGAGVILGTAAYMSPEQARGRAVDKRTDIWAFGCVLYECLSGRQAFAGETVSDLIARILEREPDWEALPSRTPQRIRDLLKRCLEKDVKRRLRDIGDARIEIEDVIATKSSSPEAMAAASRRARVKMRTILGAVALILLTAAATYFTVPRSNHSEAIQPLRFEIAEMPGSRMNLDGAQSALSPDGRMLAYCANDSTGAGRIWVRSMESLIARPIPGTDGGQQPFWSYDSRSIGYFASGAKLMKISLGGGAPETVAEVKAPRGGTWNQHGDILYAPLSEGPIYRVSANGGEAKPVTQLDSMETAHRFPVFLPDGRRFLYSVLPPNQGRYRIFVGSLDGKENHLVLDTPSGALQYVNPGFVVYERDGIIVAQRFDLKNAKVIGEPVALGDHPIGTGFSGAAGLSAARNGTLSYTTNTPFATQLVWVDHQGRQTSTVPMAPGRYVEVDLSPDGHQAVLVSGPRLGIAELWLADLDRGAVTRLSYEKGENASACWSPDGTRVAYAANAPGDYPKIMIAKIGGASETVLESDRFFKSIECWTPDGRAIVFAPQNPDTRYDIWVLPLDGDRKPWPYLVTPYLEDHARLSPDGRWMAYRSNESGRFDIYVQAFPDGGGKYRVTPNGGNDVRWSRDGRRLYFDKADDTQKLYVADVLPGPQFRLGPPRVFAQGGDENVFDYDITPDERIILLTPVRPLPPQTITIVQNWQSSLPRR